MLRRGEPVEITVVNRLGEATALHWHGIELDSYYDGVHGWSGGGQRLAPLIEPDRSFVVRFTPPRSGTFMYHTHLHDERQLPLGLYGPVIVVEPGETFDPATDHVLIVARKGLDPAAPNVLIPATPVVLNGLPSPQFVWKAGERHRVRLINITPDDIFNVALQTARGPMTWTPVAKDGATLPESLRQTSIRATDDRRRRDLRLRRRPGSRSCERLDRSAEHRREMAGARACDRQVRTATRAALGRRELLLAATTDARRTRGSAGRVIAASATANKRQASPPRTSGCAPRSTNVTPDPATRSVTVRDTSTSPRAARPHTARARSNAAPATPAFTGQIALPGVQAERSRPAQARAGPGERAGAWRWRERARRRPRRIPPA